jgi:hypothetical protein
MTGGKSDHDLLTEIHGDVKFIKATVKDHEGRLRSNEKAIQTEEGARVQQGRTMRLYSTVGGVALAFFTWLTLNK